MPSNTRCSVMQHIIPECARRPPPRKQAQGKHCLGKGRRRHLLTSAFQPVKPGLNYETLAPQADEESAAKLQEAEDNPSDDEEMPEGMDMDVEAMDGMPEMPQGGFPLPRGLRTMFASAEARTCVPDCVPRRNPSEECAAGTSSLHMMLQQGGGRRVYNAGAAWLLWC